VAVKRGLFVAPFDELVDPRTLAGLARSAEEHGWDGFFLWDHVAYRAPVRALADPWVSLAAIAFATERLRLGPLVTPLARRRVAKLARETVTLDRLSAGRLTLGVGLGSEKTGELEDHYEVTDPRERARLLDRGLDRLAAYWGGDFEALAELAEEVRALGAGGDGRFDLVVDDETGTDPEEWAAAGATWLLTGFGLQPREADVRATISAGPG
jgi:alkanesulfonate monooxygenase SsuD/methylene tetrahydromethanopterin reductase-like flavin-dependent oxidoreductase (luciferase family)